ncbi:hypothetical protein THASP1DRAFT_32998 [Thamnocephalis sphaerospora]|uniref:Uncharacterized protein n=1 Tax=Thamnocephalis sphaerospora TaxID=78915 RepID=A0A4P9XHJ1_9FUNG|nr:hypothetical protein THASP1DRAFT_32998 [Thamnocephalis sphaerospora]|eukprot:RKP05165.1 hypothetical protein THASP1DRAFT_32998 [Thamnocephalis sphaerospora]
MYFTSLFSAGIAALSGLVLARSLASALSIPGTAVTSLEPHGNAFVSLPQFTALLNKYTSNHIQLLPYFAFHHPQDTSTVYHRDDRNRTIGIDFADVNRRIVRSLRFEWHFHLENKIDNIIVEDYSVDDQPTLVRVMHAYGYEYPMVYWIKSKQGLVDCRMKGQGEYDTMYVRLVHEAKFFGLSNVSAWDGSSIRLVPGPKIDSASTF